MSGPMKPHFDIIICIPLEDELVQAYRVFEPIHDLTANHLQRFEVRAGTSGLRLLIIAQDEMGRRGAARAVSSALEDYTTSLIVSLGIAGGISSDLKLGDVCY